MHSVHRPSLLTSLLVVALGPPACRSHDDVASLGKGDVLCAQRGTLFVADEVKTGAERARLIATHGGCGPCPSQLKPGAPVGARCQAHRACAEQCCRCPKLERSFTVAACVDGRCPASGVACQMALKQFGSELCGG